jgi:hypothetical protein
VQSLSIPTGARNPRGHTAAEVLAALQGQATYTIYDELAEETGVTLRLVDQGEQDFLDLALSVDYHLRLFANDVEASASTAGQKEALTAASFTEASFTGYEAKTLTGGSWTSASGAPASASYTAQGFVSTINQAAQTMYGYYTTRVSTGRLAWYEYFNTPVEISGADEFITVTPRLTMQDTGD